MKTLASDYRLISRGLRTFFNEIRSTSPSATPSQTPQIRQIALRQIMSEWGEEIFLVMQEMKELRGKSGCWREPMDPGKEIG